MVFFAAHELSYILYNLSLVVAAAVFAHVLVLLLAMRNRSNCWRFVLLAAAAIWIVTFPNTDYLITEVRHLSGFCLGYANDICRAEAWRLPVLFLYGWLGYLSFFIILRYLVSALQFYKLRWLARWLPVMVVPVIALGVIVGLIDRWNTVELLLAPGAIFSSLVYYLLTVQGLLIWATFSLMLYLIYYGTLAVIERPPIKGQR